MTVPEFRPHLAPGLRVVRRGTDHLQIGLYAGRRVVLPRTPEVEHTLDRLLDRQPVGPDPATEALLDHLDRHGCLSRHPVVPGPGATVAVVGDLHVPGVADLEALLAAAGLARVPSPRGAAAVLVLCHGELDRAVLDPLVRAGTDHLVARVVDGGAVLGPFVAPGRTACLRCIDAHESVPDPDHVVVTTRYARATTRSRRDGVPDLDAAVAALVLAWSVRDLGTHLTGRRPSTWSRTVHLGAGPEERHERAWERHPRCGCCWDAEAEY